MFFGYTEMPIKSLLVMCQSWTIFHAIVWTPPVVWRDKLSVWTPYKGQRPLVGCSLTIRLRLAHSSVGVWLRSRLADWLLHWLAGRLFLGWLKGYRTGPWAGCGSDWLATRVGSWLPGCLTGLSGLLQGGGRPIWTRLSRAGCRLFRLAYACLTQTQRTK